MKLDPYLGGGDCRPMAWNPDDAERDEALDCRAAQLASEAFDAGDDPRVEFWIKQEAPRDLVARLALAALGDDDEWLRDAKERVCEAFVDKCADLFLPDVAAEQCDEYEY